jgi:hypothetical protein
MFKDSMWYVEEEIFWVCMGSQQGKKKKREIWSSILNGSSETNATASSGPTPKWSTTTTWAWPHRHVSTQTHRHMVPRSNKATDGPPAVRGTEHSGGSQLATTSSACFEATPISRPPRPRRQRPTITWAIYRTATTGQPISSPSSPAVTLTTQRTPRLWPRSLACYPKYFLSRHIESLNTCMKH